MLGGDHALSQVPRPADREALVLGKLRSCVGPAGGNADRDRRALERLLAFCGEQGVTRVWPLSAALLMNFCHTMYVRSAGPRGGHSVPATLRAAFVHMKVCIGLPVELDSPILFNICPHCSASALSPASTSIHLQCFWEHHAIHDPSPSMREVCQYMVIACVTSLRFKELKRSRVLSCEKISLMVSMTKDSSHDLHVDAEPVGFLGPLVWWPAFARPRVGLDYVVRDPVFAEGHKSDPAPEHVLGFTDTGIESFRAPLLIRTAYLLAGVSRETYLAVRFNVRSTRHLYPNIAHALNWSDDSANETGRWAAHLDCTKPVTRLSCAQRYAQRAMRDRQVRIRLRIVHAVRSIVLARVDSWRELSVLPDFACITGAPDLRSSEYYGPKGA